MPLFYENESFKTATSRATGSRCVACLSAELPEWRLACLVLPGGYSHWSRWNSCQCAELQDDSPRGFPISTQNQRFLCQYPKIHTPLPALSAPPGDLSLCYLAVFGFSTPFLVTPVPSCTFQVWSMQFLQPQIHSFPTRTSLVAGHLLCPQSSGIQNLL